MSHSYQSLEATLHDPFWASEGPAVELEFLRNFLIEFPGLSLEVGCGSGRLLLPLLREGFQVEGLELSEEMIQLLEKAATSDQLCAAIHHGSMDAWTTEQRYQSISITSFTLQLADDPLAVLKHLSSLLVDDGALYVTNFIPLAEIQGELPENEWYEDHRIVLADGTMAIMRTRHQIDRLAQRLIREHHYQCIDTQGNLIKEFHSKQKLQWFYRVPWKKMLEQAGFEVVRQYGDFEKNKKSLNHAQILTTFAKKKWRINNKSCENS